MGADRVDGAPQVAVGAVTIDPARDADGPKVLLIRRGREPMKGRWSLPGGRVERGESLAAAVAREVMEETGLTVKVGALVEVVEVLDDAFHYVILDYACLATGGTLRAGDDASEAAWVSVLDLGEYGVTPAVARVVSRALADGDERE